jgi:hypothetical protein
MAAMCLDGRAARFFYSNFCLCFIGIRCRIRRKVFYLWLIVMNLLHLDRIRASKYAFDLTTTKLRAKQKILCLIIFHTILLLKVLRFLSKISIFRPNSILGKNSVRTKRHQIYLIVCFFGYWNENPESYLSLQFFSDLFLLADFSRPLYFGRQDTSTHGTRTLYF